MRGFLGHVLTCRDQGFPAAVLLKTPPGTLTGTTSYDAFGAVRTQSGSSLPLGYTGQLTDPSTGFIDLRARELDPTIGRFFSADIVQPNAPGSQGYNLYAYVANNPTTWVDPSGFSTSGDASGAAATAAAVSIFSLLLFSSLAAACLAFIGCGPFLVAGALMSSTSGLLVLTGLLIAVFAEVACALDHACWAATQQIGQIITTHGSIGVPQVPLKRGQEPPQPVKLAREKELQERRPLARQEEQVREEVLHLYREPEALARKASILLDGTPKLGGLAHRRVVLQSKPKERCTTLIPRVVSGDIIHKTSGTRSRTGTTSRPEIEICRGNDST